MKKIMAGFVLLVCFCVFGCNRSTSVPAQDATGATHSGQTLTVKITGDVPEVFLSLKRGDAPPINTTIKPPYEATFNVQGSDRIEFAASVKDAIVKQIHSNLKLEVLLNGKSVASAKEGDVTAYVTHLIYTVPES